MEGTVAATTSKFGERIKLGEKWLGYAYGYSGPKPSRGDNVRVELNAKGYISQVEILGIKPAEPNGSTPPAASPVDQTGKATRAHALHAASRIVANTPQVTSGECEPKDVVDAVEFLTAAFAKLIEGENP
jgi:hypothetical protein